MKKIKALALAGLVVAGLMTIGTTDASAEGPFRNYADCAANCVNTTRQYSLDRTICAADCYVKFIGDMVKEILPGN